MSQEAHPIDALHELVDGRLGVDRREEVERHLRECERCRQDLAALSAVKRAVGRLPQADVPEGFEARLSAALDAASGPSRPSDVATGAAWRRWLAPVAVAAALALAVVLWWWPNPSLSQSAAAAVSDYRAGRLVTTTQEHDAVRLNAYFADRVSFPVRVFDLGMMGYTIEGGRVHEVGGHSSALWVYRGSAGSIICQMYRGLTAELPAPVESRVANGITFLIYHEDGGTQVFWQEGDVVCVLASALPSDEVVNLAIAKAMKP